MWALCDSISKSVGADAYHIYVLDQSEQSLLHWDVTNEECGNECEFAVNELLHDHSQQQEQNQDPSQQQQQQQQPRKRRLRHWSASAINLKIGVGKSVPGYIAKEKKTVLLNDLKDIAKDPRFPEGVGVGADQAVSFLGQPILQADKKLIGVLTLLRFDRQVTTGPSRTTSAWGESKPMTTIFNVLTPEPSTKDSSPEPELPVVKEASPEVEADMAVEEAGTSPDSPGGPTSSPESVKSSDGAKSSQLDNGAAHGATAPLSVQCGADHTLPVPQFSPRRSSNASSTMSTQPPLSSAPLSPRRASSVSTTSTQGFRLRDNQFAEEDEEIVSSYLVWGGIAMYYAELYVGLSKMRDLKKFLLGVVVSIFDEMATDKVVSRILAKAKELVHADR